MGIRVKVKGDILQDLHKIVAEIAKDLHEDLQDRTPVKTGKARDGWTKTSAHKGRAVIRNRVDYVPHLDAGGHKGPSKPFAPKGMTRPAVKQLQRDVAKGKYKMNKQRT